MKNEIRKFIITDPCYIIKDKEYNEYGELCGWGYLDFGFNEKPKYFHKENGDEITIYKIESTPNGDGVYNFKGQEIGVDAGMLCIAYCEKGWEYQGKLGARFETIEEAKNNFDKIISKF